MDKLGTTDVTVKDIAVSGYDAESNAVYFEAEISKDTVTTVVYSCYDVNRDDVIDQLDLTDAQLYYGARQGDENWDAAQIADVNGDGRVDIEDLILILGNVDW